jgi:hypothetical protein
MGLISIGRMLLRMYRGYSVLDETDSKWSEITRSRGNMSRSNSSLRQVVATTLVIGLSSSYVLRTARALPALPMRYDMYSSLT